MLAAFPPSRGFLCALFPVFAEFWSCSFCSISVDTLGVSSYWPDNIPASGHSTFFIEMLAVDFVKFFHRGAII